MMLNKILYHAEKGCYGLQKRLGLLTDCEYYAKKHFLRQRFPAEPKGAAVQGRRGSGFRRNFGEYFDENAGRLHEKYLRLAAGLDVEGRAIVERAVSRLMRLHKMRGRGVVKFKMTPRERLALEKQEEEFDSRVIGFPNGVWAYGDMLLPHWGMEPGAVFHGHFIQELSPGTLQRVRGRDIIDAGAFIGDSALVLSAYTDRRVYSFDPNPRSVEKVEETIRLNAAGPYAPAARIVPVPCGLGDARETRFMATDEMRGGAALSDRGAPVEVTSLDEWARASGADIGLIKADVEGYEQKLLRGAAETIKRQRPAMLLSVYHNASDLFEIKPFIEGLGLGYRFKVRQPAGQFLNDITLICDAGP